MDEEADSEDDGGAERLITKRLEHDAVRKTPLFDCMRLLGMFHTIVIIIIIAVINYYLI